MITPAGWPLTYEQYMAWLRAFSRAWTGDDEKAARKADAATERNDGKD